MTTTTGRNPQLKLQNLPPRHEAGRRIREAFEKDLPRTIIEVDYSELELRWLAQLQDPKGSG